MSARRGGSMLMEFVITMPILVFLIMFVLQLAYLQLAHECTAYAAFCAARALLVSNVDENGFDGRSGSAWKAATVALAWFHPQGLKGGDADARIEIPGWGKVPGSDTIEDHVEVKIDSMWTAINRRGYASLADVKVRYDCPMMIPVAGEVMAWALREDRTGDKDDLFGWLPVVNKSKLSRKDGESFPFITIEETCILPMPYSTAGHPFLGGGLP